MTRRVLVLATVHAAIAAALLDGSATSFRLVEVLAFAAAFALAGLAPLQVEVGRHAVTVTLTEAVLVVACYRLDPASAVAAAVVGEAVACLTHRQGLLKVTFNLSAVAGATALALSLFQVVATGQGPSSPVTWGAVALAVTVYALANHSSTSAVLSVVEGRPVRSVFAGALAPAMLATAVSLSIGVVGELLFAIDPVAPLLLSPIVGAAMLAVRRVATQQSEHLRFTRLYESSRRSARLQGFDAGLAALAEESRSLVAGTAAVCAAPGPDGGWRAMVVDGSGAHAAEPAAVDALLALAGDRGPRELKGPDLPFTVSRLAPSASALVLATAAAGPDDAADHAGALLAVYREIESDSSGNERAAVLAAFAAHAGLVAANARLLEEVEEALRHQVDLNRQKEEFVAVVSHELRTPLTVMLGALSTMRRFGNDLDAARIEKLSVMAENHGLRLKRLIEDLLLAGSIEQTSRTVECEGVDAIAFVDEVVTDMAPGIAAPLHAVPAAGSGAGPGCLADTTRLRQIVSNLIENAAKYGAGSPIEVAVSRAGAEHVHIAVIDHGPGVRPEDRERVFERFVQLDSSATRTVGGTGLGLYVCRKLAESLHGTIALTDTPGGGCTFTLELPAAEPSDERPQVDPLPAVRTAPVMAAIGTE